MYEPARVGKPVTDFAAYGLADPNARPVNRDDNDKAKTDQFVTDVWAVLDAAGNLLIKKHHDYGPKNIALSPGGPLNGLRVRMWDKIARINNLLDSGVKPSNESLRDSFIDLLNYSAIAMMVLDGTWPESPELDCD
jgi:hypothetical protein